MSKSKKNAKTTSKKQQTAGPATSKKLSGLDAAAKVLTETGQPMNVKAITEMALAKGYWAPGGKTPWATLYSSIIREIAAKKDVSRFRKSDRGLFELAK